MEKKKAEAESDRLWIFTSEARGGLGGGGGRSKRRVKRKIWGRGGEVRKIYRSLRKVHLKRQ